LTLSGNSLFATSIKLGLEFFILNVATNLTVINLQVDAIVTGNRQDVPVSEVDMVFLALSSDFGTTIQANKNANHDRFMYINVR